MPVAWNLRSRSNVLNASNQLREGPSAVTKISKGISVRNALGDISNANGNNVQGLGKPNGLVKKPLASVVQKLKTQESEGSEYFTASPDNRKKLRTNKRKDIDSDAESVNVKSLSEMYGAPPSLEIHEVDEHDMPNPRYSVQYIGGVIKHFHAMEESDLFKVSPDYMNGQPEINSRMRELLIDWLNQVHNKFELQQPTFYLGVSLLDRFLSRVMVKKTKLQLAGCVALWIASKFEEIFAPEMDDFITISDNAFTLDDMLQVEKSMLDILDRQVSGPSVYVFLRRYMKIFGASVRVQYAASFIAELAQQKMDLLMYKPSMLAAASLLVAIRSVGYNLVNNRQNMPDSEESELEPLDIESIEEIYAWEENIAEVSGFTEASLEECASELRNFVISNRLTSHIAVANKFKSQKYLSVSALDFDFVDFHNLDGDIDDMTMDMEDDCDKEN